VATNGAPFSLTLTGAGFLSSSVVVFDGNDVATTYGSAISLTASIPPSPRPAATPSSCATRRREGAPPPG
jgi:hypothetical protein